MPNFFSERVGGVEVQTYLLATYLSKFGWRVDFISETKNKHKINSRESIDGITVHWIGKKDHFSFWRDDIARLLKQIRPQFIYQRGRSRFTASPIPVKTARQLKAVLIYHCAEDNDFIRHFNVAQVRQSSKNCLKKVILGLEASLSDFFFHATINASAIIIAQTEAQQIRFKNQFSKDATVIRSAHELPHEPIQKSEPPMVFWIANTGRRKQPEKFIELANLLSDTPYRFVMAGPIPDQEYAEELLTQIRSTPNMEYAGPLSWDESNKFFAKATFFVNTTLPGREGFPNTYIQAWMRGTPVLTLHCDPDDLIEKHGLGKQLPSIESLAQWMRSQLSRPEKIHTMQRPVIRYSHENHDIKNSVVRLNEILLKKIPS